eukprot:m.94665 g.94665  ORF g.94665 m.94665 type:complete len:1961 (-) comp15130_c0_seq1:316-6198(-)
MSSRPTTASGGRQLAPDSMLRLEWVYGYRGHQCRSNVFYTGSGKIVYFVASVAIIYDPATNTQRYFFSHNDDIISLAMHPDGVYAVSGQQGETPKILVWNTETLEVAAILQGVHKDGVASVSFGGRKSQFVVSIGLEETHTIAVWKWSSGQLIAQAKGHTDRVFDFQVYPEDDGMVSCGVKHIRFWSLAGNTLSSKRGIFGKTGEVQTQLCIAFGPNRTTYTGTLNGDIFKWRENNLIATIPQAHSGAIFSLHQSASGYATGSADGVVRLWDPEFMPLRAVDLVSSSIGYADLCVRSVCWRDESVLCGTKGGEVIELHASDADHPRLITQGHAEGQLWGLATHPTKPVFATASDDKTVRLWDMEAHEQIGAAMGTSSEARAAAFNPSGSRLAIGHQNGTVLICKTRGLTEVAQLDLEHGVVSDLKFSPDGSLLAVGTSAGVVTFYNTDTWIVAGNTEELASYVTHVDFSEDGRHVQANSGAAERVVFRVPGGQPLDDDQIGDIRWHTWTSVLGEQANGIWRQYAETDDINAIDVCNGTAVTGDDFGKVKLFRFPCDKKGALHRTYIGHAAHVTNVRFCHDKSRVLTTGGADHAVFQWRFHPHGHEESMGYDSLEQSEVEDSDVDAVDSDVEREAQVTYSRNHDFGDFKEQKRKAVKQLKNVKRHPGPSDGLALEYVHGYRGYDCRNNLHTLSTGQLVYHVAGVGIILDTHSEEQSHYRVHTDDILCLSVHPGGKLVATGQVGKVPEIHVWDSSTHKTVAILKGGHERGVCAVAFSPDGKHLASVGLDDNHMIVVWDWQKGVQLAQTRGHKDKIFVIKFNPVNPGEVVTVGIKHIKFWNQAGGGFTAKRGTFGNKGALDTMLSLAFDNQGNACSGAANGQIYRWSGNSLASTVKAHKGPVFVLNHLTEGMSGAGGSMFLSGGKDGAVRIWNENFDPLQTYEVTQTNMASSCMNLLHDRPAIRAAGLAPGDNIVVGTDDGQVINIDPSGHCHVLVGGHGAGELWGLAVHPTEQIFATASDDCMIGVWSAQTHKSISSWLMPSHCRSCTFSHDGSALAIGLSDGSVSIMDVKSQKRLAHMRHRKESISDLKYSPDGKYLAVASHDNFVDVYNTHSHKRVGVCKGASSYVTHIDWDKSGKLIMLNSGAKELLFFEAPRGKRVTVSQEAFPHIEWDTWSSVLGKPCEGIWPAHSDVTDVNAAHLASDGLTLATGDDVGLVKLFKFPTTGKFAKFKKYIGHSAHVTNVRWLANDEKLISVGGGDTAIFVWAFSGATRPSSAALQRRSKTALVLGGGDSDDSDTDDEEDGFDSDVEREIKIDYDTKIYVARETMGEKPNSSHGGAQSMRKKARVPAASAKVRRRTNKKPGHCSSLSLSFVQGYRGFDTRDNLFFTKDGQLVYHAAAVGIVLDPRRREQKFYNEHNDDIISLALNSAPGSPKLAEAGLVATGQVGKVPAIRIWDVKHTQTVSVLRGFHKRGVCSLDFSPNGKMLASVGLDADHSIAVYRWADGNLLASSSGSDRRIFVIKFRPDNDHEFVTCGVKHIKFWTVAGNQLLARRGIVSHSQKLPTMLSVAFGPSEMTYTGSLSGDIYHWQENQLLRIVSHDSGAHTEPVFSMFSLLNGHDVVGIATGGKDSSVKLWDPEMKRAKTLTKLPEGSVIRAVVMSPSQKSIAVGLQGGSIFEMSSAGSNVNRLVGGHGEGELWGLASHPTKDIVATAGMDKTVCVWDVVRHDLIGHATVDHGARSVAYSYDAKLLAVGLANGSVVVFDTQSMQQVTQFRDHKGMVQTLKFSPCDNYLAVGCDDACVDFYSTAQGFRRVGYHKGLGSFVYHLDWSLDSTHVQFATGANKLVVMLAPSAKIVDNPPSDIVWSSWSNLLGSSTVGVWPKHADKGDVNCIAVNHNGTKAVTGDDFGFVKLFDFPATTKQAKFKKYEGHSAHVTNAVFSVDDEYVVTTGGDDSCVMVWKV